MSNIYEVFNVKQQQLNSNKLHRLFRHFSNEYSGIIEYQYDNETYLDNSNINNIIYRDESDPDNKTVTIQGDSISFMINGMLFNMSHSDEQERRFWGPYQLPVTENNKKYNLLGLIVNVDNIQNNSNNTIIHNRLHDSDAIVYSEEQRNPNIDNVFGFYRIADFDINQDDSGTYIITRDGTGWISGYRYNSMFFENMEVTGSRQVSGYLIPVAVIDSQGNYVRLMDCLSKNSFEEFLTQAAVNKLKSTLDDTYVHRSGSTDENPDYGRIGELKINGYSIKSNSELLPTSRINIDPDIVFFNGLVRSRMRYDTQYRIQQPYWGAGERGLPLTLNKQGSVWPVRYLNITQGGTGAGDKLAAKRNLGIRYGISNPSGGSEGDIYFKIIE